MLHTKQKKDTKNSLKNTNRCYKTILIIGYHMNILEFKNTKTAVITMCFGNFDKLAEYTHPTIKAYAEKIGADFIVINEKKLTTKFIHYEKFQLYHYLTKYNRIIFMDTDLIVRPDTPNLFDIVPEHKFAAFNEGRFINSVEIIRDACMKFNISLPKWDRQYYNTGVLVFSRLHKDIFKKPDKEYDVYGKDVGVLHYEQPYINLKLISGEYETFDLDHKFNCMSLMVPLTGENRLSSYVVHYASATDVDLRLKLIKEDLKSWSETAPSYKYIKNIHVSVGGGLGDQIDAEPVIRYMCEKTYKGDNIRVKSDFPRIFRHLPVRVVNDQDIKKDPTGYFKLQTLPSPEGTLWQFLAQSMCHTTDFSSISALRRILPNEDKQIRLDVNVTDLSSLLDIIGLRNLNEMVLIHPGKGWQSKTFPPEYWQAIIDGLNEKGVPLAIIGKYVSEEQGLVDIKCPTNVLDLRNYLNLNELITLISQARILLSNDSAPIHIAGAFDNWIVLLPTCKHPDHVLPYRKGTRYYKTKALYKKLTCEAIDSSPSQVNGQTIDYVIGDIIDYLPDTEEVINEVERLYFGS